ncbi:MAG: hypothetical protein D6719_01310 [Candidatus Dadabacteria bacterium]|nr:MAG: hypothetical protein D6719_01310 [Candidatus Dadabacteria bacterium]
MALDENQFKELLKEDPGNAEFAEFSDYLRRKKRFLEAFDVCFAGLSANPSCDHGRLVLARTFYDCGYYWFAVRELKMLQEKHPFNKSIKRLLKYLTGSEVVNESSPEASPSQSAAESEDTVAEAEFDFEDLDLIEEEEQDK